LQRNNGSLLSKGGMSILADNVKSAVFRDGLIVVTFEGGEEIRFPVAQNQRLARGTAAQLNHVEISPFGIHWPELDEDLSIEGLRAGDFGQRRS
jgi:hypothetical protein